MAKRTTETGNHDIGYGKPPTHSRFKPGCSGNPKGRPKGVRNFKSDVRDTLKTPVKITSHGKSRNVSTQQAALLRLREKALGGDARALDQIIRLAQAYNNEELVAQVNVSENDAALLEVFKSRVQTGATGMAGLSDDSKEVPSDGPGLGAASTDAGMHAPRDRVRSTTRPEDAAGDEGTRT